MQEVQSKNGLTPSTAGVTQIVKVVQMVLFLEQLHHILSKFFPLS